MDRKKAFDHMIRASELVENAESQVFFSMTAKGGCFVDTAIFSLERAILELQKARDNLKQKEE